MRELVGGNTRAGIAHGNLDSLCSVECRGYADTSIPPVICMSLWGESSSSDWLIPAALSLRTKASVLAGRPKVSVVSYATNAVAMSWVCPS